VKVCLIAEGCYPYVVGGVSSWIHSLINAFPQVDFSLVAILSDRGMRGKFVYDLPENLKEIHEVYLLDKDWSPNSKGLDNDQFAWMKLQRHHHKALKSLVNGENVDWKGVFDLFHDEKLSINELLMSPAFLQIIRDYYKKHFSNITFSDFLWTMRSIYLPLFIAMQFVPPKADIYHCVATGYSGIVGAMAKAL